MKKWFLVPAAGTVVVAGLAGCSIFSGKTVEPGEFERTVLLQKATAIWCGYCPDAAASVADLVAAHPDDVVHIDLHCWDDDYSTDETDVRVDELGNRYIPYIVMDGIKTERDANFLEKRLDEIKDQGSPLKIELEAYIQVEDSIGLVPDSVTYHITLIASGDYEGIIEGNLRIALTQDMIDYSDENWDGLHNTVRRLPAATAEDAVSLNPGDTLYFYRALDYDTTWQKPLTAVVWLEDADLLVYQTAAQNLR